LQKKSYTKHVKLSITDMNDNFEFETDVSKCGISVVLKQQNILLAFSSTVLIETKLNYGVTECEFPCLVFCVKKFEYFLTI
ncbi:hypothetical protein M153_47500001430, partial [Pseudoloma neurophilia]